MLGGDIGLEPGLHGRLRVGLAGGVESLCCVSQGTGGHGVLAQGGECHPRSGLKCVHHEVTQVSRDEGAKWFADERYATADHDYLRVKEVRGVRQGEG